MMLNVFDFDSIRLAAKRKCQKRYTQIQQRFNYPDIETLVGIAWNERAKPVGGDALKQMIPQQFKEMEDRYGESN